jgi:hypothetical protein
VTRPELWETKIYHSPRNRLLTTSRFRGVIRDTGFFRALLSRTCNDLRAAEIRRNTRDTRKTGQSQVENTGEGERPNRMSPFLFRSEDRPHSASSRCRIGASSDEYHPRLFSRGRIVLSPLKRRTPGCLFSSENRRLHHLVCDRR